MHIGCRAFFLPKVERTIEEYEDAFCPRGNAQSRSFNEDGETDLFRCAVADGASESLFSGLWARLLVQGYGDGSWAEGLCAEDLVGAQRTWQEFVDGRDLPWYAEEKVQFGAFAAIVGLTVNASHLWTAVAIGDSCLFHVRGTELISSFPLTQAHQFEHLPYLLCSKAERNESAFARKEVRADCLWEDGDNFLLMSDAISLWLVRKMEEGSAQEALQVLASLADESAFDTFVGEERLKEHSSGTRYLKDDDTTLMRITVTG